MKTIIIACLHINRDKEVFIIAISNCKFACDSQHTLDEKGIEINVSKYLLFLFCWQFVTRPFLYIFLCYVHRHYATRIRHFQEISKHSKYMYLLVAIGCTIRYVYALVTEMC